MQVSSRYGARSRNRIQDGNAWTIIGVFVAIIGIIVSAFVGANYHLALNNLIGNRGVEPSVYYLTTTTTAYLTSTQTTVQTMTQTVVSTSTYIPPVPTTIHLYGGVYLRNFATPQWLIFSSKEVQTQNATVTSSGYGVYLTNQHYYNVTLYYTAGPVKTLSSVPCDVLPLFVGANMGTSFSMDIYC